jgi:hypothetical protein
MPFFSVAAGSSVAILFGVVTEVGDGGGVEVKGGGIICQN